MHLRDRGGRERGAIEAREHVVDIGSELGPQHLLDLQPRDLRGVILQSAELVDELGRQ